MPRSANPQYSTYKTQQFGFGKDPFVRNTLDYGTYDTFYKNCYIENVTNKQMQQFEVAVTKRIGTVDAYTPTGTFRGCFFWEYKNVLVVAVGNSLIVLNPDTYSVVATASSVFGTTTGDVGFTEYAYASGEINLVYSDGTTLGRLKGDYTFENSTSPNLPTPHIPRIATLDGYIFLIKKDTQDIYNSDNNNPLTYTTGEFITAEMQADNMVEIAQLSNYLVAFGKNSLEYYYDAANASGSPLQRNDTFFKNIGYIGGLSKVGNKLIFLGKTVNGLIDIFIVEDSKVSSIESQLIRKLFNNNKQVFSNINAGILSLDGVLIYLINTPVKTFAINLDTQTVTVWEYQSYSTFNCKYSCQGLSSTQGQVNFVYNTDAGKLLKFDPTVYTDSGVNYQYYIRTEMMTMGTMQMKFLSRLTIVCDNGNTTGTVNLSWVDEDYSLQPSAITLQIPMRQELPSVRRLGGFRRRAFILSTTDDQPARIFGFELDLNMGSS